jgi:vancomycin resistance protein YoaR
VRKVAIGVVALALAAAAVTGAQAVRYSGEARPGVRVLGVDVGGRDRAQISRLLRAWLARPVVVHAGARTFHVPRGWVLQLDARATVDRTLSAGSPVSFVVPQRVDVEPALRRSSGAAGVLGEIARAGRAPVSASVRLDGAEVVVAPGRTGLALDRRELVRRLEGGAAVAEAPFVSVRPAISDAAARSAAATARLYLSAPVQIDYHGARRGALTPVQLARALRFRAGAHRYAVVLDRDGLAALVRPRLGSWIVRARNARFVVHGKLVSVAPSSPGRDVDPVRLAGALSAAVHGDRVAHVELGPRDPDLTTAKANALGIRRQLVSFTTDMGESSSNRIHNVHLMADFIDGTIVRPGETFSFNEVVGPRTPERGFLEGQMIVGTLVLPSIGGGVCQTATTLFNDAFEAGLPVLERHNHNLYLSHYPLGRDATVSWGGPDLKFRNDLKHAILIKSSYTDATLTFTFYGTPQGRRVVAATGPKGDWRGPAMNYAIDPSRPAGSVEVVRGSGELGFNVSVHRTVFEQGKTLREDTFVSHYIPDSPTTVYGPGAHPPGPYIVLPART